MSEHKIVEGMREALAVVRGERLAARNTIRVPERRMREIAGLLGIPPAEEITIRIIPDTPEEKKCREEYDRMVRNAWESTP